MELTGFEPVTPTLPVWCATNCAIAPHTRCNLCDCNSYQYIASVFTHQIASLGAVFARPYLAATRSTHSMMEVLSSSGMSLPSLMMRGEDTLPVSASSFS